MNKKIVLHLLPNLGLTGGTAAKVKLLIEKSHYEYVIYYPSNEKNTQYKVRWENETQAILIEGYSLSDPFSNAINIVKICRRFNCKVVHAYFPIDSISAAIAKVLYPKIKIVRSFEGVLPYSRTKKLLQSLSFRLHSQFIGISDYVMNYYIRFFKISPRDIERVYNTSALDTPFDELRSFEGDTALLSVGGLNPTKNTETLIEAVHILKQRGVDLQYYVLGDGPLREEAERLIDRYSLKDNVKLCGYCDDVQSYLKKNVIYVHPANCEGFGMAVVEAMNYRLPIIVSDSCALPELIEDDISGFVVDTYTASMWADKIEYLLKHKEKMHEFSNAAYKRFKSDFSVERYVSSIDKIYSNLV